MDASQNLQDGEFSATVERAWREFSSPPRRTRQRVAPHFEHLPQHRLPTRWGDIAAWRLGEGPAILLAHGWADDHMLWKPLIQALAERGRAIVALDLPGHGNSGGVESGVRSSADAILAAARALGPIEAVVGHSLGGLAATLAVKDGLGASKAAIVSAVCHRRPRLERFARARGYEPDITDAIRILHEARHGAEDLDASIPSLAVHLAIPALFIHSHGDELVTVETAMEMQRLWRGSEFFAVEAPNHRQTARDPAVIARILRFLG
jgi:pimeloyl-ACP methyl ester carboxylesterase